MKTIFALLMIVISLGLSAGESWGRALHLEATQSAVIRPSEQSDEARLLLSFSLPSALSGHSIDFACVSFVADCTGDEQALSFQAFAVSKSWNAGSVGWNSPWDNAGGDWDEASSVYWIGKAGSSRAIYLDVTDFANDWLVHPSTNYGIIVKISEPFTGTFTWNQVTPRMRILY